MKPPEVKVLKQDILCSVIRKHLPKTAFIMKNKCIVEVEGAKLVNGRFIVTDRVPSTTVEKAGVPNKGTVEAVTELVEKGLVKPLNGDFRLTYGKSKFPQKWKRLFKTTLCS